MPDVDVPAPDLAVRRELVALVGRAASAAVQVVLAAGLVALTGTVVQLFAGAAADSWVRGAAALNAVALGAVALYLANRVPDGDWPAIGSVARRHPLIGCCVLLPVPAALFAGLFAASGWLLANIALMACAVTAYFLLEAAE